MRGPREMLPAGDRALPVAERETGDLRDDALVAHQDAAARGHMYRLLATLYLRPPEPNLLRHTLDQSFLADLATVFGNKAVAELAKFAATAQPDLDAADLTQEYMDLFAVPTGRYVTPFEDVYRGSTEEDGQERGPLLGERAMAARRRYREAGADLERTCRELPTHVGVELSFMSFLCEQEAAALHHVGGEARQDHEQAKTAAASGYRQLQRRFLQEHLLAWFPQLSQAVQAHARSPFYRGVALMTEAFLAWDTASLGAQDQVRMPRPARGPQGG